MDWNNGDYGSQPCWDRDQGLDQNQDQDRNENQNQNPDRWYQQNVAQGAQTDTLDNHELYDSIQNAPIDVQTPSQHAGRTEIIHENGSQVYDELPMYALIHQQVPSTPVYHESWDPGWSQEQPMVTSSTPPNINGGAIASDSTFATPVQMFDGYIGHENQALAGASRDAARLSATITQPPRPVFDSNPTRTEPPQRDLNTSPIPKERPLRFPQDMYTARWVRGESKKREGWCGYCQSWKELKNSTYWYHLHYSHGISFTTGQMMEGPREMRLKNNAWEAHCSTCQVWVTLNSGEKGRTSYYRHIYKCQEKPKSLSRSSSA